MRAALDAWFPNGLLDEVAALCARYPAGFVEEASGTAGAGVKGTPADAEEAQNRAEMELKRYLTLQRAKFKLRVALVTHRQLQSIRAKKEDTVDELLAVGSSTDEILAVGLSTDEQPAERDRIESVLAEDIVAQAEKLVLEGLVSS